MHCTHSPSAAIYTNNSPYHEYYGAEIHSQQKALRAAALRLRIDFLECDEAVIDGVRFLGTTLWTDFRIFGESMMPVAMSEASKYMSDFSQIRYSPSKALNQRFRPVDSIAIHRESRAWLTEGLATPFEGKTVVVTHHGASFQSIPTRFERNPVSAAFSSDLVDLAEQADLWIHGHTHQAFEYTVGGVADKGHVLCNPRGYRRETYSGDKGENTGWSPRMLIDLDKLGVPNYRKDPELGAWSAMPGVGREIVDE